MSSVQITPQPGIVLEINSSTVAIKGDQGLSAYQVAVNNGFTGTEQEWLNSISSALKWNSTNW